MRRSGEGSNSDKDKSHQTALYGINPVLQCLLNRSRRARKLFVKEGKVSPKLKEILSLARRNNVPVSRVGANKLFDAAGVRLHQGAALICGGLKVHDLDEWLGKTERLSKRLIVALDQIEDPQNFGAVIRSAAYLGADAAISLKNKSAPFSASASKASAGALEYFPIIQVPNLSACLQKLRDEAFTVAGAVVEQDSSSFYDLPITGDMVLVMGNEGQGLRRLTRKRCDYLIHIPGKPDTDSLNVSAAAAILIQRLACKIHGSERLAPEIGLTNRL